MINFLVNNAMFLIALVVLTRAARNPKSGGRAGDFDHGDQSTEPVITVINFYEPADHEQRTTPSRK